MNFKIYLKENIVGNRKDGLNDSDIPFTNMKSNVIGEFRNKAKDIENSMTAEQWQEVWFLLRIA